MLSMQHFTTRTVSQDFLYVQKVKAALWKNVTATVVKYKLMYKLLKDFESADIPCKRHKEMELSNKEKPYINCKSV